MAPPGSAPSRKAINLTLILIGAWLLKMLANKGIRSFRIYMAERKHNHHEKQRLETPGRVFRYVTNVLITALASMLVFIELGITIAPILATPCPHAKAAHRVCRRRTRMRHARCGLISGRGKARRGPAGAGRAAAIPAKYHVQSWAWERTIKRTNFTFPVLNTQCEVWS